MCLVIVEMDWVVWLRVTYKSEQKEQHLGSVNVAYFYLHKHMKEAVFFIISIIVSYCRDFGDFSPDVHDILL